jgi:hypothetical protein
MIQIFTTVKFVTDSRENNESQTVILISKSSQIQ